MVFQTNIIQGGLAQDSTGIKYKVTGTLNPDATCNYPYAGEYDGKPYQRRKDGAYYIFWSDIDSAWLIRTELASGIPAWARVNPDIVGDYEPFPPYEGIATVAEVIHTILDYERGSRGFNRGVMVGAV